MTHKKAEDKCPTCGSRVTIEGNGTTHYYAPLTPPEISEEELMSDYGRLTDDCLGFSIYLAGFREALKKYRENV